MKKRFFNFTMAMMAVICGGVFLLASCSNGNCYAASISQEMKLVVVTDGFGDYSQCIDYYWNAVKETAAELKYGVKASEKSDKVSERLVRYYETADKDLKQHNLILRQRIKVKDGEPKGDCSFMLKYRSDDGSAALNKVDVSSSYKSSKKLENDVVGFSGGQLGNNKVVLSASASVKKVPSKILTTIGEAAEYFPTLTKVGIPADKPLNIVGNKTVRSFGQEPGIVSFPDGAESVDITYWEDSATGAPILCEISWDCPANSKTADEFLTALQTRLKDKLMVGKTKTEALY